VGQRFKFQVFSFQGRRRVFVEVDFFLLGLGGGGGGLVVGAEPADEAALFFFGAGVVEGDEAGLEGSVGVSPAFFIRRCGRDARAPVPAVGLINCGVEVVVDRCEE
jgi:hypothetical protein